MRAELRGGLRAKLLRGRVVRVAGQITAGRAAGYDVATFAVQADYGPSYRGAWRAAVYDVAQIAVRADYGPIYCGAGWGLRCPARAGP